MNLMSRISRGHVHGHEIHNGFPWGFMMSASNSGLGKNRLYWKIPGLYWIARGAQPGRG